eukprot:13215293-Ditylum_brightwellii.AAC.1
MERGNISDPWEIGKALSSKPLEGGLNVSNLARRHGVSDLARRHRVFPPTHNITSYFQWPAPTCLDILPMRLSWNNYVATGCWPSRCRQYK